MIVKRNRKLIVPTLVMLILSMAVYVWAQGGHHDPRDFFGPRFDGRHSEPKPETPRADDSVRRWNSIAMAANAQDHVPGVPGGQTFGQQLGPLRTARAFAIIHIAIFEAVNAIKGDYRSYVSLRSASSDTSLDAAVAQAAHDTLVELYPAQRNTFDARLAEDLNRIRDGREKRNGIDLGRRAADAILDLRANDGSQRAEQFYGTQYIPAPGAGKWRQDPVSLVPIALGSLWDGVRPFVLQSASHYRAARPAALNSAAYTAAFNEVKRLGGCGNEPADCLGGSPTPTERNAEQTRIGIYWGYDGTAGLGTPPRLYNQIAVHIADQMGTDAVGLARLLALVNVAMADAGLACWETKYFYDYWRPVTGIRKADTDGNSATARDPSWTPLGAPSSNLPGTPNFTPPFPAYTSGHATFGAAMFEILRNFYRTDRIAFTFVSDEFNGVTRDNRGNVRPRIPRSFSSLSHAEEENGQSRIYLGIHWAFDKTEGIAQGRHVGDYVYENAFERRR